MSPHLKRILFLLTFLALPAALSAQAPHVEFGDTMVHIRADRMEYERKLQKLYFYGNVEAQTSRYEINAETMSLDLGSNALEAEGAVRITAGKDDMEKEILRAEHAQIELPQTRGFLIDARLTVPSEKGQRHLEMWGQKLEWLGENTYRLESGGFTTCQIKPGKKPDWSVEAKEINADTEKALILKSARIQIREQTILYVPWLSYPVGTERRSGFLLPELAHSSHNGYEATLPYYLVLGQSADMTFYSQYLEKRGLKPGGEFRINLGDPAQGQAQAWAIQDSKEHEDRWAFIMQHRSVFSHGFEIKSDINLISDNEYVVDFDDLGEFRYDRAIESRLVAAYHRPGSNLTTELSWFDDLMGGDLRWNKYGDDQDDLMIQRLPEIRYSILPLELSAPLYFDLSAHADYYWREDLEAGRGTRMDLMPRIVYPDKWDALDVWAALGWREIFYNPDPDYFDEDSRAGRPELNSRISLPLERIFDGKDESNRYRHTLEPSIIYFYQGETDEAQDPLFQEVELTDERNLVGLNLESRLFRKSGLLENNPFIKEINRFELTQFYDLATCEYKDLRMEIILDPRYPPELGNPLGELSFRFNGYYGWEKNQITRLWTEARYSDLRKDSFRLGYLEDTGDHQDHLFIFTTEPTREIFAGTKIIVSRILWIAYDTHYSLEHQQVTKQMASMDFTAPQKCWAFNIGLTDRMRPDEPDEPHEIKTTLKFRIEGI
jgi:LPS-assembly protein